MTWWASDHWRRYEAAYGSSISRVDELASADWQTHVVDLTQSEEQLWANIPKTMRQAIRKGEKAVEIVGGAGNFFAFRHVHTLANGCDWRRGVYPRPLETYDIQREWLGSGIAEATCAVRTTTDGQRMHCAESIGVCLVIRWDGWSYYASGPCLEPHVMPALIWRSMLACKALGDREFEVGWIGHATDDKGKSIERFKARWGGVDLPANYLAQREAAACVS